MIFFSVVVVALKIVNCFFFNLQSLLGDLVLNFDDDDDDENQPRVTDRKKDQHGYRNLLSHFLTMDSSVGSI